MVTGSLLTTRQVGQMLNIHTNTVRRWADAGIIPAYRLGMRRDRRFKRIDIEKLLKVSF